MVILPNNGSKYPHLAVMSGKDALIRLINLDNMSGQGGPGHVAGEVSSTALTTGGENQNPSTTWINPADNSTWVFFVSPANGINAYRLSVDGGGNPTLVAMWHAGGGGGGAAVANNVLLLRVEQQLPRAQPRYRRRALARHGHRRHSLANAARSPTASCTSATRPQLTAYSLQPGERALTRTGWTATGLAHRR